MTDAEKKKFTAAVAGLAGFYGVELPKMSMAIYWDTLREHEFEALQEAMRCHIKDPDHGRFHAKACRHHPANASRSGHGRRCSLGGRHKSPYLG